MNPKLKAYLQLHLAVLLYGLTAILGDLITLSAIQLVWWRVLITSFSLLFLIQFGKSLKALGWRRCLIFLSIGALVGLHWLCFYGSIKLANASVALIAMSTTTLFTSILEPIINKVKFNKLDLIFALAIVPAMILIASNLPAAMIEGLFVGLMAAFLASLFSILTKKNLEQATPFEISFLQIFGAFVIISIVLPFTLDFSNIEAFIPKSTDWIYLIVLSLLCTTLAYWLNVIALKFLSAYESNLVVNLEPVYGIFLAMVILNEYEELNTQFYLGVFLILALVLCYPVIKKKILNESLQ